MTDAGGYAAVVVTFRRGDSLALVLASLAAQTLPPTVVVVADNDPNRSAEALAADPRWGSLNVQYLPLDENLGPAGGWAAAAEAAGRRSDRGSWLLVIDDDDPLGHPELVKRLLGSVTTLPAPQRCGGIGLRGATLQRRRAQLDRVEGPEGVPMAVDYLASGGAPLYRWSAIEQVGFFDSSLFFGFEDLDEGIRLTRAGWDLWAVSLSSLHVVADTASEAVAWREYFKSRALVAIARQRLGRFALATAIVRSTLFGGVRLAVREADWRLATARAAGALDAMRGRMGPNGRAPQTNVAKPRAAEAAEAAEALDLLFISGVSAGGAARSTLELARELQDRGHRVAVLLGDRPDEQSWAGRARRISVKLRRSPGGSLLHRAFRRATRRASRDPLSAMPLFRARFPENAHRSLIDEHRPQAVVANSLSRPALRAIHDDLRAHDLPLVLYLRESQAVKHLEIWGLRPELIVANSEHLAALVRRTGSICTVVPSAIDARAATIESTRTVLLMVNPIPENRPDLVLDLARSRPDIPVVLQESWPLSQADRRALEAAAADLDNVEVRSRTDAPAEIYRDARVLFAPYASGRPRVVVEAQHNEIPAVALDQPALAEAVGTAGVLVPPDARSADWLVAVASIWDNDVLYEQMRQRCRTHAERSDTAPSVVAAKLEACLCELIRP
ncbi:MAG: glycosyltransferase [Acidimicrobiales bacterium]